MAFLFRQKFEERDGRTDEQADGRGSTNTVNIKYSMSYSLDTQYLVSYSNVVVI